MICNFEILEIMRCIVLGPALDDDMANKVMSESS